MYRVTLVAGQASQNLSCSYEEQLSYSPRLSRLDVSSEDFDSFFNDAGYGEDAINGEQCF